MDKQVKKQWIDALRSGKYRQGKYSLRTKDDKYCCLGVLCNILPGVSWSSISDSRYLMYYKDRSQSIAGLPVDLMDDLNMPHRFESKLINMNDADNKSFDEIADFIEREL